MCARRRLWGPDPTAESRVWNGWENTDETRNLLVSDLSPPLESGQDGDGATHTTSAPEEDMFRNPV